MISKCPEVAVFEIWLKSVEFKGIKNTLKDGWHCWSLEDAGRSWLGLVSLMKLWIVPECPEGALFKIWLNSVEFKGIKNTLKDGWHCWRFGGCWTFLTGAGVIDHDWDVSFKVHGVSVSNFMKIWWLEAEIWWVQFHWLVADRHTDKHTDRQTDLDVELTSPFGRGQLKNSKNGLKNKLSFGSDQPQLGLGWGICYGLSALRIDQP